MEKQKRMWLLKSKDLFYYLIFVNHSFSYLNLRDINYFVLKLELMKYVLFYVKLFRVAASHQSIHPGVSSARAKLLSQGVQIEVSFVYFYGKQIILDLLKNIFWLSF